jgi:hypothetical protein
MTFRHSTTQRLRQSFLGVTACALALLLSACSGKTYSCGNSSTNHCYGIVSWTDTADGFSLQMTPAPLTSGDISIDDEGWLIQNYVPDCPGAACWVETGVDNTNLTQSNGFGTTVYFWGSGTAASGPQYYYLGDVPPGDFKQWIQFDVRQDSKTPSTWNVTISRPASGEVVYKAACTENLMAPNTVIEGQELAGTNDAQAPIVFFTHNAEIKGSKKTDWTTDGTVCLGPSPACPGPPPNAGWWAGEKPSTSPHGGTFFTDCC